VVAEIKRRYKECKGATPATEYQELFDLIYSIQEEPVNEDLEEASNLYCINAESSYTNDMFDRGDIYKAFKAGAEWQKQQIKKSAIYGIVAGRVKDEVFVASRWFKDDKLKPAEDIKLIIIKS
jgi:hypothetical protein